MGPLCCGFRRLHLFTHAAHICKTLTTGIRMFNLDLGPATERPRKTGAKYDRDLGQRSSPQTATMTAHTRERLRQDAALLSDAATLQHCLLPSFSTTQVAVLGRISLQLHRLTQKELSRRAASLWRALDAPSVLGHPALDGTSIKLLLWDLSRTGRKLTIMQRHNLLMHLEYQPEWLKKMNMQQRRQMLTLVVDTLKMPGGIVPGVANVAMYLGLLEPVQLRLTPVERDILWACLRAKASGTAQDRQPPAATDNQAHPDRPAPDTLPRPQTNALASAVTAPPPQVPQSDARQTSGPGLLLQKIKHLLGHRAGVSEHRGHQGPLMETRVGRLETGARQLNDRYGPPGTA